MSQNSSIEWTDATWNPVRGCTKISPGCKHCYASTFAERFRGVPGHPYEQGFDLRLVPEKLQAPLHWRKPRRIFVNSMADLFHNGVPESYIMDVAKVMAAANWHTFQVLTKRSERMRNMLQGPLGFVAAQPHIWWGVSVENREHGFPRIDHLRSAPAAVRFLSIEPLLEDLGELDLNGIHWAIVGGESGPGARPMDPDWVRSIRRQCAEACVPFFLKQWGGVQKKSAGRLLDGLTYDEMPAPAPASLILGNSGLAPLWGVHCFRSHRCATNPLMSTPLTSGPSELHRLFLHDLGVVEIEVDASEHGPQYREIGGGEDAVCERSAEWPHDPWVPPGAPVPAPQGRVSRRRPAPATIQCDLADEISPLIERLNSQVSPRNPIIEWSRPPSTLPAIPRGSITRLTPTLLELPVQRLDSDHPEGLRRRLVWGLARVANLGSRLGGNSLRATVPERRNGCLTAPLRFRLRFETDEYRYGCPTYSPTLVIECSENDRILV